nr:PREDICTED: uncharacterized protein LOC106701857 isoform X1 [Latimeria chalumnae]XP_014339371.1 PREDICTED: uncharacterized protein LOC106701857 isoform X1 [Latimeria chalumnae]XP_014339393.1 PREDICTED: uncharacterized protein LOC106701857 isoform X1 [Latimeria chalumnae]|eukprot:XP_014339314.1 PREDICTED: uncharacterized protein LOC106701857 isoform X1 [Latimeria chalumnae]
MRDKTWENLNMDFRGHHQLSFGNYSVETPHSPLSLVPDIEGSGLEWFDCAIIDIVRAGQNAEQGVPSSPCSDISKSALSSQDTNFTVPSTPVYFKQEECFNKKDWTPSCKLQATLLSSPQIAQIVPQSSQKAAKEEESSNVKKSAKNGWVKSEVH